MILTFKPNIRMLWMLIFIMLDDTYDILNVKTAYFTTLNDIINHNILMILVLNYIFVCKYDDIIKCCVMAYISVRIWVYFIKCLFFIGNTINMLL